MMFNDILRIKWCAPNSVFIELNRSEDRLYCTKAELVSIMKGIQVFIIDYPDDFSLDSINNTDFDDAEN